MTAAKHNMKAVLTTLLLIAAQLCHAEINPRPGYADPRVREVIYSENDVIKLVGYNGFQTHLKVAKGEEFLGMGSGDTEGLDVAADGNDIWIKPKALMVRTNFDIKTSERVYHFDYIAKRNPPNTRNAMVYSIVFRYPNEEAQQRAAIYSKGRINRNLNAPAHQANRNYWYCGSSSMRPVEAYDDGSQTHITFNAYAEFPAIFVESEDETEGLVNFNVENDEVVIHRIARRFILRRGNLVGCIENRSFTGGGKRLDTHTVKQDVIRETKPSPENQDEQ
ncbi:hypothetical protein MCAMS1_01749 [biofilm metagenome]